MALVTLIYIYLVLNDYDHLALIFMGTGSREPTTFFHSPMGDANACKINFSFQYLFRVTLLKVLIYIVFITNNLKK